MKLLLSLALGVTLLAQKEVVNLSPPAPLDGNPQLKELLKIRRLHVERLAGGDTAIQIRDMLIGALQNARLFTITENSEKADCILKGSAEDLVFTDTFQSSEGIQSRAQTGSSRVNGATRGGFGITAGEQESTRIAERKHEATLSIRLVNKEGDVIWSSTQESLGAKFRGAGADVANKAAIQLAEDFARARRLTDPSVRAPVSAATTAP